MFRIRYLRFVNQQLHGSAGKNGSLLRTKTFALILFCPVAAMAGNPAEDGMRGMKMYVFEEAGNDTDLTVRTSGSHGAAKNLNMVVFDGGAGMPVSAEPVPEDRGRQIGIPLDGQAPMVLEEYPRRQPVEAEMQIKTYGEIGYRQDKLKWNIAAPGGRPNVLSELQWNKVQSAVITGGTDITFADNWQAEGKISYGKIYEGKNQDSDYFFNNRQGEFSRSNNTTEDGMSIDLSADVGYHLTLGRKNREPYWQFTPKAGYAFHTQQFNTTKGFQTIPAFGRFSGLDSTYEGTWFGPWGGLGTRLVFTERFSIQADMAYHWIDYEGTGKWNLRSDFQQPKSFTHDIEGGGIVASAVLRYQLTPDWIIRLSAEYQDWLANSNGRDKTYFSDGSVGETQLNEVKWKSYGFNFGFEYIF